MSDHFNAFLVILEGDIKDDKAKPTIDAIKQIKGVVDVQPHVADPDVAIAKATLRHELMGKLFNVIGDMLR